MIAVMTAKTFRALGVLPVLVITLALVPAVVLFPLLPEQQARRVLCLVRQVRAWHCDLTTGFLSERSQVKDRRGDEITLARTQ